MRLVLLAALGALPLWANLAAAEEPDPCGTRDLVGASADPSTDAVSYVESWTAEIRQLSTCLSEAERTTCVEVQGHFDEGSFTSETERSVGGAQAAQLYRARARSERVVGQLVELGVPYARILQRPPNREASFRGVRLRLIRDCVPENETNVEATLPRWLQSPEAVAAALEAQRGEREPTEEPASDAAPSSRGLVSLDIATALSFSVSREADPLAFAPRIGLGIGEGAFYLHAFVGGGRSNVREERAFFEWGASAGGRPRDWIKVGAVFTHRIGTHRLGDPWLSQAWYLGAESEQRIVQAGPISLWVGETLSPFGLRLERGTVVQGVATDTPDRRSYAMRFDVSLILRGHFGTE